MVDEDDALLRAMANLQSLRKNLRTGLVDEDWVMQYHRALDTLAELQYDIDEWRIPAGALTALEGSGSSRRYAPASMATTRIDAVIGYFELKMRPESPSIGFKGPKRK